VGIFNSPATVTLFGCLQPFACKLSENKQKRQIQALSFNLDEDEEENEDQDDEEPKIKIEDEKLPKVKPKWTEMQDEIVPIKKKKICKNPDVDTSFLPDREREEQENRLREQLRQEWVMQQAELKDEDISIMEVRATLLHYFSVVSCVKSSASASAAVAECIRVHFSPFSLIFKPNEWC